VKTHVCVELLYIDTRKICNAMFAFERKRLMLIQKAARCFLSNRICKKLHKMQAAVRRSSHRGNFPIGKKGMTMFQAHYRMESLVFTIHRDKILKEKVLNSYKLQRERLKQRCDADKEYNLKILSELYEKVVEYFQIHKSECLHHQLFLVNRRLEKLN
jgi:hypothetical protein